MTTEELNALKDRAHKAAVEHGFHEDVKPDAYYLALAMSKAGEAITADRKEKHANTKGFTDFMVSAKYYFRLAYDGYIKGSVEDKIADTIIMLLDFAGLKGYELRLNTITQSDIDFLRLGEGLVADLFNLICGLGEALEDDDLEMYVCGLISVFSDCFEEMTGSDKDLWWFVERKIGYNEVRPVLD